MLSPFLRLDFFKLFSSRSRQVLKMASILIPLLFHFLIKIVIVTRAELVETTPSDSSETEIMDRKVLEMKFIVPAGRRYCISHAMHPEETLDFKFVVVQSQPGQNLTLSFTLMDEMNSNILISVEDRISVDVNEVVGGEGGFEMCFFNDRDLANDKLVIFYMNSYKKHNWENMEDEISELDVVATNFKQSLDNTEDQINAAIKHILMVRLRESSDLALLESTFRYVNFWSLTNCFLIGVVTFLQVYFVKTLFDGAGNSKMVSRF